jgi:hypothetical protein
MLNVPGIVMAMVVGGLLIGAMLLPKVMASKSAKSL